ncbi:MAG: DUF2252 domain-containing protein [Solirubrobacterales bacterium]
MSAAPPDVPTAAERAAAGKNARKSAPRSSHGAWEAAKGRRDPVEVLEEQSAIRVPELVPLRYGRMLVSPFTFYRGAAAIMAEDLADTPDSGLRVQACGDAHLSNFGSYASPDRDLVLDVNDFDETLPGPWEWDVKRLAASFEIAGRNREFDDADRRGIVLAAGRAYREAMRGFAGIGNLEAWYWRVDETKIRERYAGEISGKDLKRVERNVAKARRKDRLRAFSKLTHTVDGELRIISDPPVLVPFDEVFAGDQLAEAERRLAGVLEEYRASLPPDRRHLLSTYRYVHTAHKVVGVGSVGTRAWIALFIGRDEGDPLFLQVKEAQPSVLERATAPSEYGHQGERVVEGQRLMQATSDIMLGWCSAVGPEGRKRDFYVRQLWDQKGSALVEEMSRARMAMYAEICGTILARAHARSGDRIAIASYLGGGRRFDDAIADFAAIYADQNERDYAEVAAAAESGRLEAMTELP